MAEIDAEELADALNLVRSCLYNGDNETDTKALDAVCAAAEAHLASLRAPKGELEEARAELGEWLVSHPGWYLDDVSGERHDGSFLCYLGEASESGSIEGSAPSWPAAIRAALSRARGEGT